MVMQPSTDALGIYTYGDGSNLRVGTNPSYAFGDFLDLYPQFQNTVPEVVAQAFIDMANASLQQARWRSSWTVAMGLYIAHFCTLWLKTSVDPSSTGSAVAEAGNPIGFVTAESVGDVSHSIQPIGVDDSAGMWATTVYGQQLISLAKLFGKGGMQIW